jgi:hypothetical protein
VLHIILPYSAHIKFKVYFPRSVELELTSSESAPARRPAEGLDPSQVMLAIENAESVLNMITQASVNRIRELSQSAASKSTAEPCKTADLQDPVDSIRR